MKTKKIDAKLYLERVTIKDKPSNFRPQCGPTYRLHVVAEIGGSTVVLREFVFFTKKEQTQHYDNLRRVMKMDKAK